MTQGKRKQNNQIRIIAGQWRGRKLDFPDLPGLRPTTDRIRETLFNWLQVHIPNACCLDLFAGSGVLGFEALSRGAAHVDFVDTASLVTSQLKKNLSLLKVNNADVIKDNALHFLSKKLSLSDSAYQIVFLDPPFQQNLLEESFQLLQNTSIIGSGTLIYIEHEATLQILPPDSWQCLKEKKAGMVKYQLFVCD